MFLDYLYYNTTIIFGMEAVPEVYTVHFLSNILKNCQLSIYLGIFS